MALFVESPGLYKLQAHSRLTCGSISYSCCFGRSQPFLDCVVLTLTPRASAVISLDEPKADGLKQAAQGVRRSPGRGQRPRRGARPGGTHLGIDIRVKGAVLFEFFDLKSILQKGEEKTKW